MELMQLEMFVAMVEEGNFHKADAEINDIFAPGSGRRLQFVGDVEHIRRELAAE